MDLNKLKQLPDETLREPKTASLIIDLLHCLKTNTSLEIWAEDLFEDPDAYDYSADDLEEFIFIIQNL